MFELETRAPLGAFLSPSEWIDFDSPELKPTLELLRGDERDEVEVIRRTYEFVRDQVAHSADVKSDRITIRASEVLRHREGICYGKSHLIAALLRGNGFPSGICYQRLIHGETPETGFDLHALNTVYLRSLDRWIRIDARGNKPGVEARFSVETEILAFPVRPELGEVDYPFHFPEPHPSVLATLIRNTNGMWMYENDLPSSIERP